MSRMSRMSRELKNEIESLHRGDYDWGSWGAATSTPYRVKTYLTPAQSGRIKAAYEALRGRVEAKLAEVPRSKQEERCHRFEYADFLGDSPDEMNLLAAKPSAAGGSAPGRSATSCSATAAGTTSSARTASTT